MQRVHAAAIRWNTRIADALVITLTFMFTGVLREFFGAYWPFDFVRDREVLQVVTLQNQFHLIALVVPTWLLALHLVGAYSDVRRMRHDALLVRIARGVGLGIGILLGLLFLLQPSTPTSRSLLLTFAALSVLSLYVARLSLQKLRFFRKDDPVNVVVIGSTVEALPFLEAVKRHGDWGLRMAGVLCPNNEDFSQLGGVKVLGRISDLPRVLEEQNIGQVFLTGRAWDTSTLRFIADTCEQIGVTFTMDANFLGLSISRAEVQDLDGWGILSFSSTPANVEALVIKRAIDVVGSALALLLLSPIMLVVAIIIKLEDGGPVFFAQERSGLYGRRFHMLKFRSMVVDAEARKAELEKFNEMSGPVFKMARDPRITRIGSFIRKTSIDELPQFWNVLRGEMSLVGPRPPIPAEVARYERWQMRRLSMKPGITCIWQVSGRNNIDFDQWMRLDLEYIDNWSLFLDIKLLIKTVPVVLLGSGAR